MTISSYIPRQAINEYNSICLTNEFRASLLGAYMKLYYEKHNRFPAVRKSQRVLRYNNKCNSNIFMLMDRMGIEWLEFKTKAIIHGINVLDHAERHSP